MSTTCELYSQTVSTTCELYSQTVSTTCELYSQPHDGRLLVGVADTVGPVMARENTGISSCCVGYEITSMADVSTEEGKQKKLIFNDFYCHFERFS